MTDLEKSELKGITVKFLMWLFGHTIILVATAVWFYAELKSDYRDGQTKGEGKERYYEEKFKSLELQNSIYRKEQEGIQLQVNELRQRQDEFLQSKK